MNSYKGTNVDLLRTLLHEKGAETEAKFFAKLTPEEGELFKKTISFSWVPIDATAKFFEVGADLLYPEDARPLLRLGKTQADRNFRGVYRALLTTLHPSFAMEKSNFFWKLHFNFGKASGTTKGTLGILTVSELPNFPKPMLDVVSGYLMGGLEFMRLKGLQADTSFTEPATVVWRFHWE